MLHRFWIPTLAATALLLSACGDSSEPTPTPADEAPAEQSSQPADDGSVDAPAQDDVPAPDDDNVNGSQQKAPAGNDEAGSATPDETVPDENEPDENEPDENAPGETTPANVEADNETLSTDPRDVMNNDDASMPGEVTTSDVDDVISDIDKRFEQAEQELKAQFEEAEKEAPAVESLPGEGAASAKGDVRLPAEKPAVSELPNSSVSNTQALDGELGKSEVDALIEDAERRFEETQKRLQKQFEELEQEEVDTAPDTLQPMSGNGDMSQGSGGTDEPEPENP